MHRGKRAGIYPTVTHTYVPMALVGYATTDASFLEEPPGSLAAPEREVDMFVTHKMGFIPEICTSM